MAFDPLSGELQRMLGRDFTVQRELGGGGMSRVFVATDNALGREIVIKILPAELAGVVSLERFRREIALAARLQHPHIVPLLAAGEINGLPYFTMPFVEGESLRAKLSSQGELPVDVGIRILREVASALAAAHEKGIVHRDIKPDNILLSGGSAMVTDFGVAKAVDDASVARNSREALTDIGITVGTPAYMSPEQAAASPTVDARADIYAFGVMAYEMLAGRTPFAGRSPQATLAAHVVEIPEALEKLRPNLSPAVAALIMRCLEKRPADRPQKASQIVVALDRAAEFDTASHGKYSAAHNANRKTAFGISQRVIAGSVGAAVIVGALLVAWRMKTPSSNSSGVESERSVAVMPLTNRDSASEYLSLGISDEVRSQLTSKVPGLRVLSGSSSNTFRGQQFTAQDVGQRLHVALALLGEMHRTGPSLHVGIELVNVSDGIARWSHQFIMTDSTVSSLPDSIIRGVAEAMQTSITAKAGGFGTANPEALQLYLRARYLVDKRGGESITRGATLAERAIALDPKFARAYAELGIARGLLPSYTGANSDSGTAMALRAEDKAIALDSTLAEAWAARGFWMQDTYEWAETERHLRRALALDPKFGMGHKWLCQVLTVVGKTDEALKECDAATQLDPLLAISWATTGAMLFQSGQGALADQALTRAIEMDPTSSYAHETRAFLLIQRGQMQAAVNQISADNDSSPLDVGSRGYVYAAAGRRSLAMSLIKSLEALALHDPAAVPAIGLIYLGFGDVDRAIDCFIRGAKSRVLLVTIGSLASPQMDALRSNARFPELLRVMNLDEQPVAHMGVNRAAKKTLLH